jgi:hypothetical protein
MHYLLGVFVVLMSVSAWADSDGRPANVPGDYIVTPGGYAHPSCVREVTENEVLEEGGIIRNRLTGQRHQIKGCLWPRYDGLGAVIHDYVPTPGGFLVDRWCVRDTSDHRPRPSAAALAVLCGESSRKPGKPVIEEPAPALIDWNWLGNAMADYTGGPGYLYSAWWQVPNNPQYKGNQTIYFFPARINYNAGSLASIVQPVLEWNKYTGWRISSWNCCIEGVQEHSPFRMSGPGHMIFGQIIGNFCDPNTRVCAGMTVITTDFSNGRITMLDTPTPWGTFDTYVGGALEVWNLDNCTTALPTPRQVDFAGITLNGNPAPWGDAWWFRLGDHNAGAACWSQASAIPGGVRIAY